MKVTQFILDNRMRLGMVEGDLLWPLRFPGSMVDFIVAESKTGKTSEAPLSLRHVRFAPVVSNPTKIIALGLNYLDHAKESKGTVPKVPLIFAKFPNSLIGHNESIVWHREITKKVDFEAELAVVMGKKASRCAEKDALDYVFGYCCANDVSARDLQFGDGQWVRGKSLDTFCPLGPWIVTKDEVADPHSLAIKTTVNGTTMQDSSTAMMIFKIPQVIHFLARHLTLMPGDIILTGTPHGVGAFREPSIYLKDGDEVVVEIEKVGRLVNTCKVL
ncbi:MAG: fumarylacetoacetate hydrolase family protein [Deltaproteobacteria bacterium]|nr:fumarylacetoacetate hydrolase family protein [Deltaproteobacteria bacterium]